MQVDRDGTYKINVSSMQMFYQCRFRWWAQWIMNRVPIATSPALDAGKLLHTIFERHFLEGITLLQAADEECEKYRLQIPKAHPDAQTGAMKALTQIIDLREALPLWEDKLGKMETLEVEEGFEYQDPELLHVVWIGRPDRPVLNEGRVWHMQNRGLAANTNFGTYTRLARRHYHEHLYGEVLEKKYCTKKNRRTYGGTIFNLVRKMKFRTNVGRKDEKTKSAEEMFYQGTVAMDLKGGLHRSVMASMRQHAEEMIRVYREWEDENIIPAPNEKMNGGFSGSSEDPYFRVLIGEIKLSDDKFFKPREDTYATPAEEAS